MFYSVKTCRDEAFVRPTLTESDTVLGTPETKIVSRKESLIRFSFVPKLTISVLGTPLTRALTKTVKGVESRVNLPNRRLATGTLILMSLSICRC